MISNFFIYCSGASVSILDSISDVYARNKEKNKYVGLGLSIVLISILSAISATFFITYAFSNKTPNPITGSLEFSFTNYYILAGVLWALIVFSIDRNIIVGIKKTGVFKEEFARALPRLILAIFIGIVISTPLEMKFFEKEITERVEEIILNDEKGKVKGDIESLKTQISTAEKDYNKIIIERDNAYSRAEDERSGNGLTGQKGYGDKTKEWENKYEGFKKQSDTLFNNVQKLKSESNNIQGKVTLESLRANGTIQKYDGAEKRIIALHQLNGFHWLITILFIILEITPVLVKLMMERGTYDEYLDRIEYENKMNQQIIISNINDSINTELKISTEKNQNKLDAELKSNKELMEEIAQAQAEIAKEAIKKWKEEELNKLKISSNHIVNNP